MKLTVEFWFDDAMAGDRQTCSMAWVLGGLCSCTIETMIGINYYEAQWY